MSTRNLIIGALLAVAGFCAVYVVVTGQPSGTSGQSATSDAPGTTTAAKPTPKPKPFLEGWAKPAATLVLSGEMRGYLEPCGCTAGQHGGLGRRADLIESLEKRGWPLAGFDVGGLMNRPNRTQSVSKLASALRSLDQLQYKAIGLGREEVQMDPANLWPAADESPFVSANLVIFPPDGELKIQDAFDESYSFGRRPWKLVQVGDVKIAVTSVFGLKFQAEVMGPSGRLRDIAPVDPIAALKMVLPKMQAENPDLLVLLSHATVEESKDYAAKFPEFDIVVTAGSAEDGKEKPERVGKTLVLQVGAKGKTVGVVGFYPEGKERLKYELADLDSRFEEHKSMKDQMALYQEMLKELNIAQAEKAVPHPGKGSVDGGDLRFVGAAKCGECHTKAFSKLKNSRHAHAYDSLITGRKDEKHVVARNHDPECLSCHVTGWDPKEVTPYISGYLFEEPIADRKGNPVLPDLKGQQCENCHGPGSKHVEAELAWKKTNKRTPEVDNWRKFMHNDLAWAKANLCIRCHDGDNSPKFKFEEYWEKVKHPGKD